ncbi:MAG: ATP-binding protein, partial [Candidatus Magasanikbacteria bacterium]|nr:ATP-binding protein [Candidatus Magasanikbacteria bacterium]
DADHVLLEFAVTDTGIGIAKESQELLFKPFSQVDNSDTRRYGGSGLGLSITKNLAELMGGSLGVESDLGKGSRFWFRVQLRRHAPGSL